MRRFWRPAYDFNDERSFNEAAADIDAAMRESVRYHNVADVEVGSFLSSGIDSSYMAACLAKENPAIKTFTVGFAEYEGERDEVSWAHDLAEQLNIANTSATNTCLRLRVCSGTWTSLRPTRRRWLCGSWTSWPPIR